MSIQRLLVNLCTRDLEASKAFYTDLFSFKVNFDSDWFVQLVSEKHGFELGLIQNDHEVVPQGTQGNPQGFYLTLVVEDVDKIYQVAQSQGIEIIEPPSLTPYGQKRMILKTPEGANLDVSSPANE